MPIALMRNGAFQKSCNLVNPPAKAALVRFSTYFINFFFCRLAWFLSQSGWAHGGEYGCGTIVKVDGGLKEPGAMRSPQARDRNHHF